MVTLRERLDLTPSKLEKRATGMKRSLTAKTITNIEKNGRENSDAAVAVTEGTLETLSLVLKVTKGTLTGDEPMPPGGSLGDPISIQISPELGLTFDLIERKYGISFREALELTPLLLTITANKSLEQQRLKLMSIEEKFDYRKDLIPANVDLQDFLMIWGHAVRQKNVFVKDVNWVDPEDYHLVLENPFASFLIDMCKSDPSVLISKKSDEYYLPDGQFEYIPGTGIPSFSICADELHSITLGSLGAGQALKSGVVRIEDIPDELWTPRNAGKRVEWLEEKYLLATSQDEADETS